MMVSHAVPATGRRCIDLIDSSSARWSESSCVDVMPSANTRKVSSDKVHMPATSQNAVEKFHRLVEQGRTRWRRLSLVRDAGLFMTPPLLFLWLIFRVDNVVHLPVWARAAASGALFDNTTKHDRFRFDVGDPRGCGDRCSMTQDL